MSQTSETDRQAAIEQWIINACAQLGLALGTSDDDFFEAGGTSLAVVRIIARVEDEFGFETLSPEELIEESSVRQIAATILRNSTVDSVPNVSER